MHISSDRRTRYTSSSGLAFVHSRFICLRFQVDLALTSCDCSSLLVRACRAPCLHRNFTGVFFLFGQGRLHLCRSQPAAALVYYQRALQAQNQYRNLHHISFWEMAIANLALWDVPASLDRWRILAAEATVRPIPLCNSSALFFFLCCVFSFIFTVWFLFAHGFGANVPLGYVGGVEIVVESDVHLRRCGLSTANRRREARRRNRRADGEGPGVAPEDRGQVYSA